MTIQGKVGSVSRDEERAQAPGHGPVLLTGALKAADGVYPVGLMLTRGADGKLAALAEIAAEVLGAGDGVATTFSGTLAAALPVAPGTVSVTDGVETFADDGSGRLVGDAGGSGTVNCKTGAVAVTFNAAVVNLVDVTVDYITAIDGVLDDLIDTAETTAGNYIAHGTARRDVLKVGKTAQAAPSSALFMAMQAKGIYPVG